jgi:hypothetical protein
MNITQNYDGEYHGNGCDDGYKKDKSYLKGLKENFFKD